MNLIQILNGYAADLDVSGPQYATMAHYIRAGVKEIERVTGLLMEDRCTCDSVSLDPLQHHEGPGISSCRFRRMMTRNP